MITTSSERADARVSTFDGVTAMVARLEAIVRRALPVAEARNGRPEDDPFRGLHVDAETIARTLDQPPVAPLAGGAAADDSLPDGAPPDSQLAWLAAAFGLSAFDVDVLILAVGPELDLRYERIYSYLQDDVTRRRPSVSLALDLLCASPAEKLERRADFSASGALLRHPLIEWVDDPHRPHPSLLASSFRADPQILRTLLGEAGLDGRLAGHGQLVDPVASLDTVRLDPVARERLRGVVASAAAGEPLTLSFYGRDEDARIAAAHGIAGTVRRPLLKIDLTLDSDVERLLPVVFREADLHDAVLLLERWDAIPQDSAAFRRLQAHLTTQGGIVVLSGQRAWLSAPLGPRGVVVQHFDVPAVGTRAECWAAGLALTTGRDAPELARTLGSRFRLSGDQIWDATLTARRLAQGRSGPDTSAVPGAADFFAAARAQSGHELASVATRVVPVATWRDIVLPPDAVAQLREVCDRVVLSHRVLDEWGFDRRLSHGKGVTALFSGPSGTGKTMAAEVIADELGLDLYHVEISRGRQQVDRRDGEEPGRGSSGWPRTRFSSSTRRTRCSASAARCGTRTIATPTSRSATCSSGWSVRRGRHPGHEPAAEHGRGLPPPPLVRRAVPLPNAVQRRRIWERIWPEQTPVSSEIDFARLARTFTLTGGNVKNVALAAAFSAAERNTSVEMTDVIHAIRREYQKLGKNIDEAELANSGQPANLARVRA